MIKNPRYKDMTNAEISNYAREIYGMFWPPDYKLEVPCGHCLTCQKSENSSYRIRLMYEIRRWPANSCLFVTLTFNDENLKRFSSDPNQAVRLFLDRMRKNVGKQVRHWFIGEYGSLNGRPHYHGILFNVPENYIQEVTNDSHGSHATIERLWSYGFVFVGYVNDKTCSYITKYLTKSLNNGRVRPRVISSKGIGSNFVGSDAAKLCKIGSEYQPFIMMEGYKYALPRYYREKIFSDIDRQNMILDRYLDPHYYWQGKEYPDEESLREARRQTNETNLSLRLSSKTSFPSRKRESLISKIQKRISSCKTEFDL